jgi:hypothetical protein
MISRSCVPILINSKGWHLCNIVSCKLPKLAHILKCCPLWAAYFVKLPLYLLEEPFWTLYWCWLLYCSVSVSLVICSLPSHDWCMYKPDDHSGKVSLFEIHSYWTLCCFTVTGLNTILILVISVDGNGKGKIHNVAITYWQPQKHLLKINQHLLRP